MGCEQRLSAPRLKHVPAQLQPAPGEQLPPFVQSSAAPHVGPVEQLSGEHTHAPSVPHVLSAPLHVAVPLKILHTP